MRVLTKEQIQGLAPEKQEVVASLTLAEAKRRALLLETAKRHRGKTWIPLLELFVLMLAFFVWHGWTIPENDQLVLLAVIVVVSGTAQWQVTAVNRRLDALMELLETDLQSRKAEPSAGGNAAPPRASA
jgi:hypothetical protein